MIRLVLLSVVTLGWSNFMVSVLLLSVVTLGGPGFMVGLISLALSCDICGVYLHGKSTLCFQL